VTLHDLVLALAAPLEAMLPAPRCKLATRSQPNAASYAASWLLEDGGCNTWKPAAVAVAAVAAAIAVAAAAVLLLLLLPPPPLPSPPRGGDGGGGGGR